MGIVLGVVFVVLALGAVLVGRSRHEDSRTATYSGGIARLSIDLDRGVIDVTGDGGEDIRVVTTRRWGWGRPPRPAVALVDGELRLVGRGQRGCGVSYTVAVPRSVTIAASNLAGSVVVRGTTGAVTATSRAGPLSVDAVSGRLRLRTGAGRIAATDVRSSEVFAASARGSITLGITAAPDRVEAVTSRGDVELVLPDGAYAVDADCGGGTAWVGVIADPSSPRRVRARSSAGQVVVHRQGHGVAAKQ